MMLELEGPLWEAGQLPGGVDEAGRGPLYGPVVAACVVMPPGCVIEGVNDSKQLSGHKRDVLAALIWERALAVGVGEASVEEIDRLGINPANKVAMERAVMKAMPSFVLIDYYKGLDIPMPQASYVKGDQRSYLIAAASIIAKTSRDALMVREGALHPGYGLAAHKGYGSAAHRDIIRRTGPLPGHRERYVRKTLEGNE